jgi:hypothetical protein
MRAEFVRDFLPHLGRVADVLDIHRVERETGGFQLLVMAGNAVFLENGLNRDGRRRCGGRPDRLWHGCRGAFGRGWPCRLRGLRLQISHANSHDPKPAQQYRSRHLLDLSFQRLPGPNENLCPYTLAEESGIPVML